MLLVVFANAASLIRDSYADQSITLYPHAYATRHGNRGVRRGEFDRVRKQISQNLLHTLGVESDLEVQKRT